MLFNWQARMLFLGTKIVFDTIRIDGTTPSGIKFSKFGGSAISQSCTCGGLSFITSNFSRWPVKKSETKTSNQKHPKQKNPTRKPSTAKNISEFLFFQNTYEKKLAFEEYCVF